MKILLGDVNAELGREDNSKPRIGIEDSNNNGVRVARFATLKVCLLRVHCSGTKTFLTTAGPFLMG